MVALERPGRFQFGTTLLVELRVKSQQAEASAAISVILSPNDALSWISRNKVVNSPWVQGSALSVGEEDIACLDAEG